MNIQVKKLFQENVDVVAVFTCMLCVFSYIMFVVKWDSDLPAHAMVAKQMLEDHQLFSSTFLIYFLVNLLTLFTGYKNVIRVALILLIALANTAKYTIVREAFKEWTTEKIAKYSSIAMLLVFVIPLLRYIWILNVFPTLFPSYDTSFSCHYFGYYVPNVWHNSTIICMMPFAIACYLLSVKQFTEYSDKRNWCIALLLALSIFIKPSFFFIYAIAYPLIILSRYGFKKEFFRSLIPILIGGICLAYEYISIYFQGGGDGSSVAIDVDQLFTLDFWKSHALYLIVSMLLPILFVCLYWRSAIRDREFWFVLLMLIFGLGIMWCCSETGPRAKHGNFGWQAIAAMWFVYYYILKSVVRTDAAAPDVNKGKRLTILIAFGLHVVTGCIYLAKFLIFKDFG